ncbi:MAG: methionyl-tRNA formyltransferase [Candidatus Harrisonbacteria bacterium CG10_big_fil_rev_8_21_14_0_10_42_17]|uniref:methionyl-tRNA formyltransferase n=1 Tax=Candidatus Harrisonbacteria bacterium CG10_big_fil_rev_8_21_14_0_10_42_17 TaxID=1974584 RepID=A0A2M6WH30_9BACT|nr:MAG: methionyl-tRNA formyltransferase [Candidatus Harrisonbacteria bacterium CG10_big_fil_rev_8_21_14_0_10_42_17]
MKFVFFGTPRFAGYVLESLIEQDFLPALLICNPDRPVGRKKTLTPPPTKIIAKEHSIPFSQHEVKTRHELSILQADFYIVAAYGYIVAKEFLTLPTHGTIGVHPSLLPVYRGATPIQAAIMNQDATTGVALYLMDEKMDHGPILADQEITIEPHDTYLSLEKKLADLGSRLLCETIPKLLRNEIQPQEQNHNLATFTRKLSNEDGYVSPSDLEKAERGNASLAREIDALVRALAHEPGVWTERDGKRMKIHKTEISNDGNLALRVIQFAGMKPHHL